MDQEHLMPSHWEVLQEVLPNARLQDGFGLIRRIRATKSPYEIQMLRQSSACTETAVQASLEVATNGATDHEIQAAFEKSLIESGAEHLFSAIGVGSRASFPNVIPNGTPLEQGGLLRYDAGCRYRGYC